MWNISENGLLSKFNHKSSNDKIIIFMTVAAFAANYTDVQLFNKIPIDYIIYLLSAVFILIKKKSTFNFGSARTMLVLLFVIYINATALWSPSIMISLAYSSRFVFLLCLYYMIINLEDTDSINSILRGILAINLIASIISIFNTIIYSLADNNRFAFFIFSRGNSNLTAFALGFCTIICLYFIITNEKKRYIYIIMSFLFTLLLLLTNSRGNMLALIISLLFMFKSNIKQIWLKRYKMLIISGLSILFLGVTFLLWLYRYHNEFLVSILRLDTLLTGSGRTDLWVNAIKYIINKPLFGYGAGTYQHIVPRPDSFSSPSMTHNSYLEIAFGGGLISLALFVGIIIVTFRNFRKNRLLNDINFLFGFIFLFSVLNTLTTNLETHRYLWLCISVSELLGLHVKKNGNVN